MYPTIRGMPSSGNLLSAKHIPFKRFISSKSHLHFKKDQDYRRVAKKEKKNREKDWRKKKAEKSISWKRKNDLCYDGSALLQLNLRYPLSSFGS